DLGARRRGHAGVGGRDRGRPPCLAARTPPRPGPALPSRLPPPPASPEAEPTRENRCCQRWLLTTYPDARECIIPAPPASVRRRHTATHIRNGLHVSASLSSVTRSDSASSPYSVWIAPISLGSRVGSSSTALSARSRTRCDPNSPIPYKRCNRSSDSSWGSARSISVSTSPATAARPRRLRYSTLRPKSLRYDSSSSRRGGS